MPVLPLRPEDLSEDTAAALIDTMVTLVREKTSLKITVTREMIPKDGRNVSNFVVTVPPGATEEQLADADQWIREIGVSYRYSTDPAPLFTIIQEGGFTIIQGRSKI